MRKTIGRMTRRRGRGRPGGRARKPMWRFQRENARSSEQRSRQAYDGRVAESFDVSRAGHFGSEEKGEDADMLVALAASLVCAVALIRCA